MATRHSSAVPRTNQDPFRALSSALAHLVGMETTNDTLDAVLSLSELDARLR